MVNDKITDVGIDIDGVIFDFASAFHEYCSYRLKNDSLPMPTHWDFYLEWGLTFKSFNDLLKEATVDERLFMWRYPIQNSLQGWESLKNQGLRIHILTHRASYAYSQTTEWLEKHKMFPDTLHFGYEKDILKHISHKKAAAVDDYTKYYDMYDNNGVMPFLMTQPWNIGHRATRVTDLLDFATKVKEYNEK